MAGIMTITPRMRSRLRGADWHAAAFHMKWPLQQQARAQRQAPCLLEMKMATLSSAS